MPHKSRLILLITTVFLISMLVMASAAGWKAPLSQTGMDMPTATMEIGSMDSTPTPVPPDTSAPLVNAPGAVAPSPTMTSIFTGFTPYPTGMPGGSSSLGGCGSGCGGTGGAAGMGGYGSMGTTITGTVGMAGAAGMGSMSSSGMDMSGCPMMSGSEMSSMGASDDLLMSGMDMSGSSLVAYDSGIDPTNPWIILGWVVLGVVILALIAGAVVGMVLLVRQFRQAPPA